VAHGDGTPRDTLLFMGSTVSSMRQAACLPRRFIHACPAHILQAQGREDVVRLGRLAKCLGALIRYLVAFKHRTVRMLFDSSALPNGLVLSSETLLPSKDRTVRMVFDASVLPNALAIFVSKS
jgi:hypothetical protein